VAHSIKSLIESWDGIGVVMRFDQETGTWIFIALHSDQLGMPSGGTRMKVYPSPSAGLRDAMRLARGMTQKWAAVGLNYGGGKAVLSVPRVLTSKQREGLLRRYGRLIESLKGSFATGPDLGTSAQDMSIVAQETAFVHGVDRDTGVSIDPGPYTAKGVFEGIKATMRHVFGSESVAGRVVHIQGVGGVGDPLARLLKQAGAQIILSDLDSKRAERLSEELGGSDTFEPHTAYEAACDVYAPCAVGGTLNSETIRELKCRIVVGSANNQLEGPEHGRELHERGILYAPDYIVNAGGAIALGLMTQGVRDAATIDSRIAHIGVSLAEILKVAKEKGESPDEAATRVVRTRLNPNGHSA